MKVSIGTIQEIYSGTSHILKVDFNANNVFNGTAWLTSEDSEAIRKIVSKGVEQYLLDRGITSANVPLEFNPETV